MTAGRKGTVLEKCTLGKLNKLKRENAETGILVMGTQEGCEPCPQMEKLIKKTIGDAIPLFKLPAEDAKCEALLHKMKITETPSVAYMNGKKTRWLTKGDKTDEDIIEALQKLVAKVK